MAARKAQVKDIKTYCAFIRKCKKYPWIFNTPLKYAEKFFHKSHTTYALGKYYGAVLAELGAVSDKPLSYYASELKSDELLKQTFKDACDLSDREHLDKACEKRFCRENYIVNYYALIRILKPKIVIETGTDTGGLTSWVLSAMHKNNCGKLLSIDIPSKTGELTMETDLSQDQIGKFIPEAYRNRWELHLGDAKELLPKLLLENNVDMFIHDSLHTRTHMLFEYNCARALMRPGTVIISHDILWNKAFFDFTASHNLNGFSSVADPNLGLTVNRFDEFEKNIGLEVVRLS